MDNLLKLHGLAAIVSVSGIFTVKWIPSQSRRDRAFEQP
jgi:hypothetical protein